MDSDSPDKKLSLLETEDSESTDKLRTQQSDNSTDNLETEESESTDSKYLHI